ncbi:MAG: GNAT family N-acetyltransferase [Anaerolineales bacterium]|nr:GNAT family N-acetyltransferase [Anaerolineales bacterium]
MTNQIFSSKSGKQIAIRDLQPDDANLLVDLFYHLSADTIYKRFHSVINPETVPPEHIQKEAERLARIDPECDAALVAVLDGKAIGVARYHRISGAAEAESAIVIRDDYQREGLGTHLLMLLRDKALAAGVTHLIAMVQSQNNPILKVIKRSGLKSEWRYEQAETYLAVDLRD